MTLVLTRTIYARDFAGILIRKYLDKHFAKSQSLPPEFAAVINDNFWDLI